MRIRASFPLFGLLLLAPTVCFGARVLNHYDVDSLVYLSDGVVLAEVGKSETLRVRDGECVVHSVKVISVFQGDLRAGETYRVTGLDAYRHGPGLVGRADGWDPIQAGEKVYLFLGTPAKATYAKERQAGADWAVLESGLRLQVGEKVYSFGQLAFRPGMRLVPEPGGPINDFVTMTPAYFENPPVVTIAAFEERVRKSQEMLPSLGRTMDPAVMPKAGELEGLVALLRDRQATIKAELARDDVIGAMVAQKVVPVAMDKPALLDELRKVVPQGGSKVSRLLEEGMQMHAGREYVMKIVGDTGEPMERRMELARLLGDVGAIYRDELQRQERRELTGVSTELASRLAKLAVENFGTGLTPVLAEAFRGVRNVNREDGALGTWILMEGFTKAVGMDRYGIAEAFFQGDMAAFREVMPRGGSFLTMVEPAGDMAAGLAAREIRVQMRFRGNTIFATRGQLVLRPVGGGADVALETRGLERMPERVVTTGNGWRLVGVIPAGMAAGRYEVLMRAGGEGLGFEVEVK